MLMRAFVRAAAALLVAVAVAAPGAAALSVPGSMPGAQQLRLRGGGIEQLAGEVTRSTKTGQTERDPAKRKELFNSVPRMNHKEQWQKWKADRMPKKSRGPLWRELRDFMCGSVVGTRDFVLDNSGLLIYKALPFAIALLHLPMFKDVTEGMKVFE